MTMPRPKSKATKVAYDILGAPQNEKKQKRVNRRREKRLQFEDTQRTK